MREHSLLRMVFPSSGLFETSRSGGRTRRRTNLRIVRFACVISPISVRIGINVLSDDTVGYKQREINKGEIQL